MQSRAGNSEQEQNKYRFTEGKVISRRRNHWWVTTDGLDDNLAMNCTQLEPAGLSSNAATVI